jgi:hypothetical protein
LLAQAPWSAHCSRAPLRLAHAPAALTSPRRSLTYQLSRFCRCAARRGDALHAARTRFAFVSPAVTFASLRRSAPRRRSPAWLTKVAGLITFALLLMPAFVRVAYFYFTSPKGERFAAHAQTHANTPRSAPAPAPPHATPHAHCTDHLARGWPVARARSGGKQAARR